MDKKITSSRAFHAFDRALNQQQIEHIFIKATQVKLKFLQTFHVFSLANNKELKEWTKKKKKEIDGYY